MLKKFTTFFLTCFVLLGNLAYATESYHFDMHKQLYPLASFFSIQSNDTYRGIVKKSIFRVRTNFDLSDQHGWQATGIKRILSLGSIYPWATEIDIYNTNWQFLGMIDGQVVSTAAARFSIYNEDNELVGIAYLDWSLDHYTIVYPNSEAFPIAQMNRQRELLGLDWWHVHVYDAEQIDERVIRLFAAMVCDLQDAIDNYYLSFDFDIEE